MIFCPMIDTATLNKSDMAERITIALTADEETMLMKSGHSKSDINQIASCVKKTKYFLKNGQEETPLSPEEAINILGRDEWAKGVARATFYGETTRWGLNDERVTLRANNYAR